MARADAPDVTEDRALTIYVDGSSFGSPRRGGMGIRFVWVNDDGNEETWEETLPATKGANNNQMELEAPSAALELADGRRVPFALSRFDKIVIRTDSRYVSDNVDRATYVWSQNGWTKSGGGAVLNAADWQRLLKLMRRFYKTHHLRVRFEWVPGKKGKHAKGVDKSAKASSNSASFGRSRPTVVRRKTIAGSVDRGSVKAAGQVLTVRIIEARYLRQRRRTSQYKYEVLSPGRPESGAIDWAESELPLRPGRTYSVRMNAIQQNPRIEELLEEVEEDLTPYVDALRTLGEPSTVREVTNHLAQAAEGAAISPNVVRLRLERLVESEMAQRARASTGGRPYTYEAAEPKKARPSAEGERVTS